MRSCGCGERTFGSYELGQIRPCIYCSKLYRVATGPLGTDAPVPSSEMTFEEYRKTIKPTPQGTIGDTAMGCLVLLILLVIFFAFMAFAGLPMNL